MRRVLLAVVFAGGALCGLAEQASAFHHVIRARCINYYPGPYSYGYCGAPCAPPYTFPCTFSYPKYCGPWANCYDGRVRCSTGRHGCGCGLLGLKCRGWGCFSGLGCGLGYGLCGARCCGSAACGYGYCGVGCGDSCGGSCGGTCGAGGCVDGSCGGSTSTPSEAGGSYQSGDERIIYDGPAENAPPINNTPPAPEPDSSTGIGRSPFRLTSAASKESRGEGLHDFNRGMRAFWDDNMTLALEAFEAAVAAEPQNPLYAYYRALAMYNLHGPDAANDWLAQAVELERRQSIPDWGRRMERVQGRARIWVEQARAAAHLGG